MAAAIPLVVGSLAGSAVATAIGGAAIIGTLTVGHIVGAAAGFLVSGALTSVLGLDRNRGTSGSTGDAPGAPPVVRGDQAALINTSPNTGAIDVCFGYFRKRIAPKDIFYREVGGANNEILVVAANVCMGPIYAIDMIYLDGEPYNAPQYAAAGVGAVSRLGDDTQTRNDELERILPGKFATTDINTGVAYIVVSLPRTLNTATGAHSFQNEPLIEVEGRGLKLYDPRDGQTRFSNNPALAIRAWLANARWGREIPDAAIDDVTFEDEADYYDGRESVPTYSATCTASAAYNELTFAEDQPFDNGDGVQFTTTGTLPSGILPATTYCITRFGPRRFHLSASYANSFVRADVPLVSDGTGTLTIHHIDQPRYTCNGVMNVDNPPLENLLRLRSSAQAWLPYVAGKYRLASDRPFVATVRDLNENNMLGAWAIEKAGRGARYNRMRARFFNPQRNHEEDFAIADSTADRTADGERLLVGNIELDFTTNLFMARRIAELERRKSRLALGVSCTGAMPTFRVEPADVVSVTQSLMGWSGQQFRVIQIGLGQEEKFEFQLREYADIWTGLASGEAWTPPTRTNLPKPNEYTPPKVSGLRLFNQPTDREFQGRDAKFEWRSRSVFNVDALTGVAGEDMRDPWADGWLVEIWNTAGTVRRRSEVIRQPAYTYSYEKNLEDATRLGESAAAYAFEIRVKARSRYGRVSEQWARVAVSNPAPTITFSVSPATDGVQFDITPSSESDYSRTRIYASTRSGFTPGPDSLKYEGSKLQGTIGPLFGGLRYYLVAEPFDVYRQGTTSNEVYASPTLSRSLGHFGDIDGIGALEVVASLDITDPDDTINGAAYAMYCPSNGMLYVMQAVIGKLSVIDPVSRTLVKTLESGVSNWTGSYAPTYCPSNNKLYLDTTTGIKVIDPATNEIEASITRPADTRPNPGLGPLTYCPINGLLYHGGGMVVDPASNTRLTDVDWNTDGAWANDSPSVNGWRRFPQRFVYAPGNQRMYLNTGASSRYLKVCDPADDSVDAVVDTNPDMSAGFTLMMYCAQAQRIYLAGAVSGYTDGLSIGVVNLLTHAVDDVLESIGNGQPGSMAYCPDTQRVYVTLNDVTDRNVVTINPNVPVLDSLISQFVTGSAYNLVYVPTVKQMAIVTSVVFTSTQVNFISI
jgi:hypothetical protein